MVLCNIPPIFKNVSFDILEDCVRCVFPNFVTCFSPVTSASSRIIVTGTKQLLVAIWYLFCTMKQLFFKTFGRNFNLFWRRALVSDQNRMAVHVRGGAVIWRFWFVHCKYQSYCTLIIYRFQIHLLLLVDKLYSFFCFRFSDVWKNTLTCIMWVIQEACY